MKALYVFALTGDAMPSFAVDEHRVEFIDLDGLHAAIAWRTEPPILSESSLRAQHDIVMRLSEHLDAVVPARFGALIDELELRDILAVRRETIQNALSLVRGRTQMTVRFRGAPRSKPLSDRSPAGTVMTGAAYLEARRRAARTMPAVANVVTTAVAELAIAERSEAGTGRTPAALYHLIDRGKVSAYVDAISRLQLRALSVSGPWAPFAFAPDLWP